MRIKAFSRFNRIKGFFLTREAIIDATFNSHKGQGRFTGFPYDKVKAEYSKKQPNDGQVLALIFEESEADEDFFLPDTKWRIWMLSIDELEYLTRKAEELRKKTDDVTEDLLGRGWGGKRPHEISKLHTILAQKKC